MDIYLSTDSVITAADTLAETFTTSRALPPGGSEIFPFEGEIFVDIPKVAPGTYFVGYLADDVGQVFETSEVNNYVSAASAQLTVVADLVITTTSPLPGGTVGAPYASTQLTATGGVGAYHWVTAQSGPLPAGLELSDGGLITGTPKVNGTSRSKCTSVTRPPTHTMQSSFCRSPLPAASPASRVLSCPLI